MDHIQGASRDQLTLFPEALDDFIAQENPVRFIDAYIDSLDFQNLSFRHAILQETGRPPYHPADLLKLYLYGYLNRIRLSRMLERESHRNLEVTWLIKRLTPDFKTIADFRRDNRQPIRQVCREFTLFCHQLDLFSGDLVAIDGSKFKAVNRRERNITRKQLKRTVEKLDEDIERYLRELDEADEEEPEEEKLTAEELQRKIEEMKRRRVETEKMDQQLEESSESQISFTDPAQRSWMLREQPHDARQRRTPHRCGLQCPAQCRREAQTHPRSRSHQRCHRPPSPELHGHQGQGPARGRPARSPGGHGLSRSMQRITMARA
jgi:transposase